MANPGFFNEMRRAYLDPRIEQQRIAKTLPAPWIQKVIDQGDEKTWGYIFYRALDDGEGEDATAAWESFYETFVGGLDDAPLVKIGLDEIWHSRVTQFVDFDGQESELGRLREQFRTLRDEGKLKPGVLANAFLLVTRECRDSWRTEPPTSYPWFWAIDPDWPLDGADEEGYDGRVRVAWARCYDKLYDFLSTNRFSLKDIWRDFNDVRQQIPNDIPTPGWAYTKLDRPTWPDN